MSEVVKSFLEPENDDVRGVKHVTTAGWEDAPHLTVKANAELLASTPVHERDARTKGIPQLGRGAIYPLAESDILVPPLAIQPHWPPRLYALDVGWHRTSAIWMAHDRELDIRYIYHEYYRSQAEPVIHPAVSGVNYISRSATVQHCHSGKLHPTDRPWQSAQS